MPLSEFIHEARRLAELCNYPNNLDRVIRDMIVSGIQSLRVYQKCIDFKELSLQDCINICKAEDAIRMQVLECRSESVKLIQSAQTVVPVHKLQNGSRQSSNSNRHRNKTTLAAITVGHKTGPGSTLRYTRLRTILVVDVGRRGILIHCAEVPGHPYSC